LLDAKGKIYAVTTIERALNSKNKDLHGK